MFINNEKASDVPEKSREVASAGYLGFFHCCFWEGRSANWTQPLTTIHCDLDLPCHHSRHETAPPCTAWLPSHSLSAGNGARPFLYRSWREISYNKCLKVSLQPTYKVHANFRLWIQLGVRLTLWPAVFVLAQHLPAPPVPSSALCINRCTKSITQEWCIEKVASMTTGVSMCLPFSTRNFDMLDLAAWSYHQSGVLDCITNYIIKSSMLWYTLPQRHHKAVGTVSRRRRQSGQVALDLAVPRKLVLWKWSNSSSNSPGFDQPKYHWSIWLKPLVSTWSASLWPWSSAGCCLVPVPSSGTPWIAADSTLCAPSMCPDLLLKMTKVMDKVNMKVKKTGICIFFEVRLTMRMVPSDII